MSLLMDALRKAEQEKKEAARRLREQDRTTGDPEDQNAGELTLVLEERPETPDTREQTGPGEVAIPDSGASTGRTDQAPDMPRAAQDLSLSPLDEDDAAPETGSVPQQKEGPPQQTPHPATGDDTVEGRTVEADGDEAETQVLDQLTLSRSGERASITGENERPPPPGSPTRDPEQDTLRDTLQDGRLTATVAGTIERDVANGGRGYSPATAQSVFAARRTTTNYTMHTVVAVIVLSVIAAMSYGVIAYYAATPAVLELPSPTVARGVEQVDPVPVPLVEPARVDEAIEPVALIDIPIPSIDAPATPVTADIVEDVPVATGEELAPETVDEAVADAAAEPESEVATPETPQVAEVAMHTADAPDMLELKPALLRISRSQPVEDRSARAVNDAYEAYRQGRYDTANALYGAVLTENPDHRDALLGMAAIAMRAGQYERAFDYYTRVLRQNPSDRVAQTALISLQTQADPVASESRIRLLLEDTPEAPYLHFTLGNLFASQSRWPDAQRAFFDAYRLDSGNADYALNLAVSLDRLGQPRAARDYYRRALELADVGDVNFDTAQVSSRLQALSAVLESQ